MASMPAQRSHDTSASRQPALPAVDGTETAPQGTWPHALSHEPLLKVSDVLRLVQPEFPTLSPSKLRFLDTQGLVEPHRTPAGYRAYSPADVERLRFVLRQQRDHYRPLTVIGQHLSALDSGTMQEAVAPRVVGDDAPHYLTATDVAKHASVDESLVATLEQEGLIAQAVPGRYRHDVVSIVATAHGYLQAGGDLRTLRTLRNAARREVDHGQAAAAGLRAKGASEEGERVEQEFGEAAIAFFSTDVRANASR